MSIVGTVKEIWRYPVKSMAGERIATGTLTTRGVVGDRGWAIKDEKAGEIRGAKKLPALMRCHAAYVSEPTVGKIPQAVITLPDGTQLRTDAAEVNAKLSALLGRPVTIWPLQPESARDFYKRAAPDNPDMMVELREIFGRLESEPLPDMGQFPAEILQFTSPLGTFFDVFAMHVVTTASLEALSKRTPGAKVDVRRFRPNVLVETRAGIDGFAEADWSGKTLRIGTARIKLEMPCVRCVMTTLEQAGLPKEPAILRTIVREAAQNFGSYATVAHGGTIAVGDEVALE